MMKGWLSYAGFLTAFLVVALLVGTATPSAASREGRRNTGLAIAGVALLYALSQSGSDRDHYRNNDYYRHNYNRYDYRRPDRSYYRDSYRRPSHSYYRHSYRYQPRHRNHYRSHRSRGGHHGSSRGHYGW